jgi:hypothetical protein
MTLNNDQAAVSAVFALPDSNGAFEGDLNLLARRLAKRRRAVILAFAPKAAGTFFRAAAVVAADGQLVRTVHAQGERDAQFYLPTFVAYYLGQITARTLVTHVHMQALAANQKFIEAFDLKPVVMLRSIPDMLASYCDMLEHDASSRGEGLNGRIPRAFPSLTRSEKTDFLVDMLGPWYASYFATWLEYAHRQPKRTLLLTYADFVDDPARALQSALTHSGIRRSLDECQGAIAKTWPKRQTMRFNHGVEGRGHAYFSTAQYARLERMLRYYGLADEWVALLLGA